MSKVSNAVIYKTLIFTHVCGFCQVDKLDNINLRVNKNCQKNKKCQKCQNLTLFARNAYKQGILVVKFLSNLSNFVKL